MDPISLIEAALVAGATASAKDAASQAIKDAYSGLKMRLSSLLVNKPKARIILEEHATDPETYEKPLRKVLSEAHVDQNSELIAAAQQVIALAKPQQVGMGKYTIQNAGHVQGQAIGDGNTITQHFGDLPRI